MSQIITVHSYRGGTGKSSTAANLAVLLASAGRRVALVDTDIQTPALDVLFGDTLGTVRRSLSDYLVGRCEIEDAAYPAEADAGHDGFFVVPARSRARAAGTNEIMGRGYDVGLLREGFDRLIDSLALDVLLLDTHAGFNNETVTAMASSDALVVVTRADRLDMAGAAETMSLADRLGCGRLSVAVNMVPAGMAESGCATRWAARSAPGSPPPCRTPPRWPRWPGSSCSAPRIRSTRWWRATAASSPT
ncbi:MinD/ParA family protein [Streptomyces diastatochromogenes]|nr:MinD/ParA family protein [Streptomyces diastatochromogenes]